MVKYSAHTLNRVYGALSDATRRSILQQLAAQEMPVSELASPFRISLPAVSRHLRVLENAGLLARERQGRIMKCRVIVSRFQTAGEWLADYRAFWQSRFEALDRYLLEGRPGSRHNAKRPGKRVASVLAPSPMHLKPASSGGTASLDATFSALADATRRRILRRLRLRAASVTELAAPFAISLPAISKHVNVLERAGLLVRAKEGRIQYCHLLASPLQHASVWIGRYGRFSDRKAVSSIIPR